VLKRLSGVAVEGNTRCGAVLAELKALADPARVAGMARYGINSENAYGVTIPELRAMAKRTGRDHALAGRLWSSKVHEARILASMVDDPGMVSEAQMERWVAAFDSWDVCDQCCNNLFVYTPFAHKKAVAWSCRDAEFVKRAGFVLMAVLAVHDKGAADAVFERFFPVIVREASDGRNFVKKAVNWALRQIGKRNARLHRRAVDVAERIGTGDSKAARWVAAGALRELTSAKIGKRFK
jgi:3-methyladenine DNA glycosylase AlkD